MNAYTNKLNAAKTAVRKLKCDRINIPATPDMTAKAHPSPTLILPEATGRLAVLFIIASVSFSTTWLIISTVTFFGQTRSQQNATDVTSMWRREVLSRENVTVEAGTFASYRLNQTAGNFPGIPGGSSGGNETAYFSNDAGFYVKRVAYSNGTPVSEMRLKSYSYGAAPSTGLDITAVLLVIAVVAAILVVIVVWRRRKARIPQAASPRTPPAEPVAEKGGNDRPR